MKDNAPLNFQDAGMADPSSADVPLNSASMKKLRVFKDVLRETPVIVLYIGTTTFNLDAVEVHSRPDLVQMVADFRDHEVVTVHSDADFLPNVELMAQLIGARIYVLEEIPDHEMTPTEHIAVGTFRHRISLADYTLLLEGKADDLPPQDGNTTNESETELIDE